MFRRILSGVRNAFLRAIVDTKGQISNADRELLISDLSFPFLSSFTFYEPRITQTTEYLQSVFLTFNDNDKTFETLINALTYKTYDFKISITQTFLS